MSVAVEFPNPAIARELKKSLFDFIFKNIPSANVSAIDDVVLSYVVTIFEGVSDDSFDVDAFVETMGAYVPSFNSIDEGQICTWVLEVEADLFRQQREQQAAKLEEAAAAAVELPLPTLSDMLPPPNARNSRSSSSSESEEEVNVEHVVFEGEEYTSQVQALREMFPNTCLMEIKHCISIADGQVDVAAATLLHRRDNGQAMTGAVLPSPRQSLIDDITLKYRIIERYSYVDKNSGKKEHRPLAPKIEPKKLVRYRDNKVVSLKGEKYTEVSKSGVEEENLKKPKKHCP